MQHSAFNIAVFASGTGSNARNIILHFAHSELARVALVVSNNADAGVLGIAEEHHIPAHIVGRKEFREPALFLPVLEEKKIDFIVLAGFLWLIPPYLVKAYHQRMVNIHPSLLPKYGGKGMHGMHVHEAVFKAGDTESGVTIHYVNDHYDEGQVIFQKKVELAPGDNPQRIAAKVLAAEHEYFPKVVEECLLALKTTE